MSLLGFQRYDQEKLESIKEIPGVIDVVQGKDIDIVILEKTQNPLQLELNRVRNDLKTRGIDLEQIAFMYQGDKSILNPKPTEHGGAGTLLSFRQVGEEALRKLGIITGDGLDAIIPPPLLDKVTYSVSHIIAMNGHLLALDVNPADVKVGAKFLITTLSGSEYVLTVNEQGLFEIKDDEINLKKPNMLGSTFVTFNNIRQLIGSKFTTSVVQKMVKFSG